MVLLTVAKRAKEDGTLVFLCCKMNNPLPPTLFNNSVKGLFPCPRPKRILLGCNL